MSLQEWAKNEVEIACKRENPDRKEGEFDYGCACYESALKAFESLCEDGHSGIGHFLIELGAKSILDLFGVHARNVDTTNGYASVRFTPIHTGIDAYAQSKHQDDNARNQSNPTAPYKVEQGAEHRCKKPSNRRQKKYQDRSNSPANIQENIF